MSEREKKNELNRKKITSVLSICVFSSFKRIFSNVVIHFFVGFGLNSVFNSSRKKEKNRMRHQVDNDEDGGDEKKGDLMSLTYSRTLPPIYQYAISMCLLLLFFHHQIFFFSFLLRLCHFCMHIIIGHPLFFVTMPTGLNSCILFLLYFIVVAVLF